MSVGQGSLESMFSYIGVGRETTFGTYNTCTAGFDFLSSSIRTIQESKILEQVETKRTYSKQVRLGRVIEGELEAYYYPDSDACNYLMASAMGGTITTAQLSASAAYQHTFSIGNPSENSYSSICINIRKGQSAGAQIFEYSGLRVNEMMFTAEIDEPLKVNFGLMGKDVTSTSNDVASALGVNSFECLNFIDGVISIVSDSIGAATTTAFWHVQSVEFGVSNNIKADSVARRIGSDTVDVLPYGIAALTFNAQVRYDTSTSFDAMLSNADMAALLTFQGSTISGTSERRRLEVRMPILKVNDGGDPEIGGPDEVLSSSVVFHVMRDDSSAGGYAMQIDVVNSTTAYT